MGAIYIYAWDDVNKVWIKVAITDEGYVKIVSG